ncbi:flagellar basal body P-ring formation chaperone FlgA [Vibrio methylphosphonaticus]|uniref:flagellar basal body P-ring formation chaperone FlgA n=1 Tax=Vibrio methylphosphonaticus TaxID=2946866 RepID=UPI00202A2D6B|nr:flagellar basal body P-ring formation chaperone FlgA [Vibrio methylphosphonaticus]MCL9777434.1 flagellar basal body P-ring formation protein FlgA [Vibrio methylphosphonaticus]
MLYYKTSFSNTSSPNFKRLLSGLLLFIVWHTFFFSALTHAATPEQIENIQKAAEAHVLDTLDSPPGAELSANAGRIDSRVHATNCVNPLLTSSSNARNTSSNVTVLVECPSDNWRLYVPVRLTISLPLVAATRPLARGSIVTQNDVMMTMIDKNRFRRQGFTDFEQVVGSKLKRNVKLGDVIERNDVCVVCRNEKVVIRAVKSGMTISTKGTALSDGSNGDQVRVKNDKSQRIIEGIVTGVAEITVNF